MRISLVYAGRDQQVDGIREYTQRLAVALASLPGVAASWQRPSFKPAASDIVLLQYNPFSYGRWGLAPQIVLSSLLLRLRRRRCRLALMVHEPYVAATDVRTGLMSVWQRPQLIALRLLADSVLAVSQDTAQRCGSRLRPPVVVPVGSNLPDGRRDRAAARAEIGVSTDAVVIVTFAASPAGRAQEHVAAATRAVSDAGIDCVLLVLGIENAVPRGVPPNVRVHRPGYAPERELAGLLASGDIFVAPFVDGVSTRRTALMAALQHGLAVVGTTTTRSDPVLLLKDAIVGVPVDDVPAFGRAVALLAADPAERERRGRAARSLYEMSFSWEQIAEQVLAVLTRQLSVTS